VTQDELHQKILGRVLRWDSVQKLQRLRLLAGPEGIERGLVMLETLVGQNRPKFKLLYRKPRQVDEIPTSPVVFAL
jgi:hypothetical protein